MVKTSKAVAVPNVYFAIPLSSFSTVSAHLDYQQGGLKGDLPDLAFIVNTLKTNLCSILLYLSGGRQINPYSWKIVMRSLEDIPFFKDFQFNFAVPKILML